ncbi:hypothetical protein Tco_0657914 [Tanacetum coccineum]
MLDVTKDEAQPDIALMQFVRLNGITFDDRSYSNANWINHVEDSSSTSRWVFLLGGGAISWASKKQTCITGSTMCKRAKIITTIEHEVSASRSLDCFLYANGCERFNLATRAPDFTNILEIGSRGLRPLAGSRGRAPNGIFGALNKFEGYDFRRWQKKLQFLLKILKVVYVLTTSMPELLEDATVEAIRDKAKSLRDSLESKYTDRDSSESDKGKGKEVVGPSVNMAEEGKNKNKKQNKGKKRDFKEHSSGSGSNKKPNWNVRSVVRLVTSRGIAVVIPFCKDLESKSKKKKTVAGENSRR